MGGTSAAFSQNETKNNLPTQSHNLMSGVETLGCIASATQLAAYGIKIVLHLSEIYAEIRGAPRRTKEQISQVRELIEIVTLIEQHRSLQSPALCKQLQTTLDEARSLYDNLKDLANLATKYTTNPLWRYWAITKGASTKGIQIGLEKLDRHKSTLKLCVSLVHTDLLTNIEGGIRSISINSIPQFADQSLPALTFAATHAAAINTESRPVRKTGGEVLPVIVMPENHPESTTQTPDARQQSGFQFGAPVSASGDGHFVQATGDITYNRGPERNSPFKHLSFEDRNKKLHDLAYAGKKSELKVLLDDGVDLHYRGPRGNTALHRTIPNHHTECAELLIEKGADVDARGADDATPLMLCAQYGDHETAAKLLKNGADTEMKNLSGQTALMIASRERNWLIVQLLRDGGADINATDNEGWTARRHASRNGHEQVVALLEGAGAPEEVEMDYE